VRIAALDLGSNSFHLIVVEARLDGSFETLAREREMLRLGDLVARTGAIGREAMDRAVEVIRRFKTVCDAQRADEIVALGTAALREAADGGIFVDRVADETGIKIQVVDGVREAELIFAAIKSSVLIDPGPAIAADLGGGSLEIMVGDRAGLGFAASLQLGVGRLTARFVHSDPPSAAELDALHEHIAAELAPVMEEALEAKPKMLIVSSGTFTSIARMATLDKDGRSGAGINQLTVSAAEVAVLAKRIMSSTSAERARLAGADPKRIELLPAGVAVLEELLAATGLSEFTVSEWALREGIVITAIGQHDRAELDGDPRALRRSSVLSLCRRSNWRSRHARHTARLATEIFDATAPLHGLGPDSRELLELAALLHDIGEHVSRSGHDRHTAYLIENGGLRGFAPTEIHKLVVMGRYHVRGTPKPGFDAFGALDAEGRAEVLALTGMLRIADALDASHGSPVERVDVVIGEKFLAPDRDNLGRLLMIGRDGLPEREFDRAARPDDEGDVELVVYAHGAAELELWSTRRKQELFERVFGCELAHRIVSLGRARYDPERTAGTGLG